MYIVCSVSVVCAVCVLSVWWVHAMCVYIYVCVNVCFDAYTMKILLHVIKLHLCSCNHYQNQAID